MLTALVRQAAQRLLRFPGIGLQRPTDLDVWCLEASVPGTPRHPASPSTKISGKVPAIASFVIPHVPLNYHKLLPN